MDINGGGTADGTTVDLYDCNNTAAQVFIPQSNGSLYNPQSNKCLDDPVTGAPAPSCRSGTARATPTSIGTCRNRTGATRARSPRRRENGRGHVREWLAIGVLAVAAAASADQ